MSFLPLAGDGGLWDVLGKVRDPRRRAGMRYPGRALLAGAVCAVLSGSRSFAAIAEWVADQTEEVRRALGFNRTTTPGEKAFRMFLQRIDGDPAMNIRGKIITLDALHTQHETASLIVNVKDADYLMSVKANQPTLLAEIENAPTALFSPGA